MVWRYRKIALGTMIVGSATLIAGCVGVHNAVSDPIKCSPDIEIAVLPKQAKVLRIACSQMYMSATL